MGYYEKKYFQLVLVCFVMWPFAVFGFMSLVVDFLSKYMVD